MTEIQTEDAKRIDRLFMIAFVPVILFMLASFYVRIVTDADPLWSELATPTFLVWLGVRALVKPAPPESRKTMRVVGILLLALAAIIVILAILDSQGA